MSTKGLDKIGGVYRVGIDPNGGVDYIYMAHWCEKQGIPITGASPNSPNKTRSRHRDRRDYRVKNAKTAVCTVCHTLIWLGASLCRDCYTKKVNAQSQAKRICPQCGDKKERRSTLCRTCRHKKQRKGTSGS